MVKCIWTKADGLDVHISFGPDLNGGSLFTEVRGLLVMRRDWFSDFVFSSSSSSVRTLKQRVEGTMDGWMYRAPKEDEDFLIS